MDRVFQPQTYRIADIVAWHDRKELILSPEFQRRRVWSPRGKSYLCDTVVRGMPLPQFFIREKIDPKTKRAVREVVDGQQRLSALLGFISGEAFILPVHHGRDRRTKLTWGDLSEDAQREFLSYPLSVNVLENISDADVLQIFSRINSYSLPLNRQELLNAEYVGEFKQAVDMLGREHLGYWRKNRILTDQQIARMKDLELTVELIAQMMRGLQNQRRIISELYKRHDDAFPEIDYLAPRFADTLEHVSAFCQNEVAETIYRRPPVFYSLFGAIYDLRYGFESGAEVQPKKLVARRGADVTAGLLELSLAVQEEDVTATEFAKAARFSTDKIEQRRIRFRILREIVAQAFQ